MIISDLTYLEVTSEAGSVIGGGDKGKDKEKDKKNKSYNYNKKVTQVGVINSGNAVLVYAKNKSEVYIDDIYQKIEYSNTGGNSIEQTASHLKMSTLMANSQ
jgi:hypothetical protein